MLQKRFDVTSIGSTMLRLSVPYGKRLEYAESLDLKIGGTESNTLIALAKMGARTGWVSRLTENPIGRKIARDISSHCVDTSEIIWTDKDRNEIYFLEFGNLPRKIDVTYDRSHSAISKIKTKDINLNYLFDTKIFHHTGIFPALSDNCLKVSHELLDKAKLTGVTTSFDVNYRSKLWSPKEAKKSLEPILGKVDILFISREDAIGVFRINGTPEQIAKTISKKFKTEYCVLTLGNEGAIAFDGKKVLRSSCLQAEGVDRVGRGDCYSAGVLLGYLEGSIEEGLCYGAAMSAIKMTIEGDLFLSHKKEVLNILEAKNERTVGR